MMTPEQESVVKFAQEMEQATNFSRTSSTIIQSPISNKIASGSLKPSSSIAT